MKKEFIIRTCRKCGATVEVLKDCTCENCGIKCCGEVMAPVIANTVDAAVEKHKPVVEKVGAYIIVSVPHVTENDHYIEWIGMEANGTIGKKFFAPGDSPKAIFPYVSGSKVYEYCNKHGMWSTDVE